MTTTALTGATIVLPDRLLDDHAVLVEGGRIAAVVASDTLPRGHVVCELGGGWLLPGFIDTQVNGGGDVLLNDAPTVAGVEAIARAHRRFGTTGLLPTLISDYPAAVSAAIAAVNDAIAQGIPGVLGIHIEGPHLNAAKRGIHDVARFEMIGAEAIARITRSSAGTTLLTIAPELAPDGAIRALTQAGVIVAAGHSMADYATAKEAIGEGLSGFTHLFNAMTQLESREPGMVGAALDDPSTYFGLIVDGVHVHPATLRVALAARGCGGAMLVTDAMPPVGGQRAHFSLMGRDIQVVDGTCRAADGTLAGSALTMVQALRNAMDMLGLDIAAASRLASGNPARFLRLRERKGAIAVGLDADLVHLDQDRRVVRTWIGGEMEERGE
jgi:N-acetylglucosamine-6-phosphate deacetylase